MRNYAHATILASIVLLLTMVAKRGEKPIQTGYEMLWSDDPDGADKASKLFREALRRDPASPYRWADLGAAFAIPDARSAEAGYCYKRAVELGPKVCPILLRAANFSLESGDIGRALTLMASVLGETAQYDFEIFGYYRRLELPVEEILKSGIPADARAVQSWFRSLLVPQNGSRVRPVWNWTVEHRFADDLLAAQYVNWLMGERAVEDAAAAWQTYMGNRAGDYRRSNFVFNGGFESAPTGSPLDWTLKPSNQVEIARDSREPLSGAWSLRIRFRGGSGTWEGVSQLTVVPPGAYLFRARIRTENIPGDSGVQFRISDAENVQRLDATTEPVSASAQWSMVEKRIVVGEPSRLLRIGAQVLNSGSGTAWIDGVELERADSR